MTRFPAICLFLFAFITGLGAADTRKTILFFGDSLTAGYGLEDSASQAYPALIQQKIDAASLPWRVVNAGLSGETSAGGIRRVDWILRQPVDIFVLELGGNDGLRGLPLPTVTANLQTILNRVRAKSAGTRLVVAGMRMPLNMGAYAKEFDAIFAPLAEANSATLIPFLLEGVGGNSALNQPDGIHPTAEGHRIVAETVWKHIEPLLQP